MTESRLGGVVRFLHERVSPLDTEGRSDAHLVRRCAAGGDAEAFDILVRRHGGLVRRVCRRMLDRADLADDAFQATWLVFARRAGSIRKPAALSCWLHCVACRVARAARDRRANRPVAEAEDHPAPACDPATAAAGRELGRLVEEEVARLPLRLRQAVLLCYWEGLTNEEAGRRLGWPCGTVKTRLARARAVLHERLTARGVVLPAGLLALLVSPAADSEAAATTAATRLAGGTSVEAASLAHVVLRGSALLSRKLIVVVLLVVTAVAAGAGAWMRVTSAKQSPADEEPPGGGPQAAGPVRALVDRQGDPLPAGAVLRLGTTRLRTGGNVTHLAFSPDDSQLASWSNEMYVSDALCVWDTRTGRLRRRVDLPGAGVKALTWLGDGRGVALLAQGDPGRGPLVWEFTKDQAAPKVAAGAVAGVAVMPAGPVPAGPAGGSDSCYAVSPDGKTIAVGWSAPDDFPRPIFLRALKTGRRVDELRGPQLAVQPGNCGLLWFTPDGKRLVAFSAAKELGGGRQEERQTVVVWDVAGGKEVSRFTAPRPADNGGHPAVAVSNRVLAIGLEDGGTSRWDLAGGTERRLTTAHVSKEPGQGYGTFAVAFTPDGKTLVTGGRDGMVKLWDVATGRHLHTLARHYSWVEALAVSADGRTVASSGQDGVIRLWDTATGADACVLPGHCHGVNQAALCPDGRTAVTSGWDHTIRWWDTVTGQELRHLDLPARITGLAVSPDGRTVLGTTDEGGLRTWDLATGRDTTPAGLPRGVKVGALAFTPGGRQLVSASGPHISVWDWPALRLVRTFDLPRPAAEGENACQGLAISPDGRWLVTAAYHSWYREEKGLRLGFGANGVADVWDLATGKRLRRLAQDPGCYQSVTFTADGRVVLIGSNGTVPAEAGRAAQRFRGPMALLDPLAARWIRSFDCSGVLGMSTGASLLAPDGRTLYVSNNFGQVVGFEVATGRPRRTLSGHRGYVPALGISPDGRRLISGGKDGSALVWDITLAGAARPRKDPLTAADARTLWTTATGADAQAAFAALADLATAPELAVDLLRQQVKPVAKGPTDADLDRVVADLDSPDFATREKAACTLAAFGEAAVPGVRKRLGQALSPEVRRRARAFLDQFDVGELSPRRLRQLRAVELLEGIGTPAARGLLSELAAGAPGAPLTLDAAAALQRLK
jgi:RNA polymerase sigma factor (sigma-70 family)